MHDGNIFELKQRAADGKWNLWVQRTPVELGIVTKEEFNAAGQPFWMTQTRWIVAQVYDKRPTTSQVMAFLGFNKPTARRA